MLVGLHRPDAPIIYGTRPDTPAIRGLIDNVRHVDPCPDIMRPAASSPAPMASGTEVKADLLRQRPA